MLSCVLLSCVFSGLRWVLRQLLLSPSDGLPSDGRPSDCDPHQVLTQLLLSHTTTSAAPTCAAGSLLGALLFERAALD